MVEMGQIKVFVQELRLKTSISAEGNLDLLTLAGSGPPNFEVLPLSTLPLKGLVNFGRNELLACPLSVSFKIKSTFFKQC